MSSFTAPLDVRQHGDQWFTLRAFVYYAGSLESDEYYTVPAQFRTDFASIPRMLWTLIGHPAGKYAQAAVLHDWLYATAPVSRQRADALFFEAMGVLRVRRSRQWALWSGVRVGGWWAWWGHRRRARKEAQKQKPETEKATS